LAILPSLIVSLIGGSSAAGELIIIASVTTKLYASTYSIIPQKL
jgi:hypothetical protein